MGSNIKIDNGGSPLFHVYTLSSDGIANPTTLNNSIYFEIPNNASSFPSGSNWLVGYSVTMPSHTDTKIVDNWVSFSNLYTMNQNALKTSLKNYY